MSWDELVEACAGRPNPEPVFGDPALARAVLADHLGSVTAVAAVYAYVTGSEGAELARSLLGLLRPPSAAMACYEIYGDANQPIEHRRAAVELVRVVADARALPWVDEWLGDPDEEIQHWGASVLDRLVWEGVVELARAEPLIQRAEAHDNRRVRDRMLWLREELYRRKRYITGKRATNEAP